MKGLLYSLADMMQMPIKYNHETNKLTGGRTIRLLVKASLEVEVRLRVIASLVNEKEHQVGMLVHVKGNLLIYMANNGKKNALSAYVIDLSALVDNTLDKLALTVNNAGTIKASVGAFYNGIKKSYMQLGKDNWVEFELPKGATE